MNVMSNVVLNTQGTEKVRIGNGERQSQVLEGDVIFNGSSETPEEVGFGSAVPIEISGLYLNSFCFGFRRKDTKSLDPRFFAYLTRSPLGRDIIRPMAQGSTRYNIAKTNLLNGRFPLPPLKEQVVIAEALSDADAAIESLDALIAKKLDVKQAMMQQLLTGRTRLPGFNADWKEVRLGEICEFVKTIALSRSQLEADHGVGCIHYGDIHTKFNDRLDCSNVQLPMAESGMVAGVPRLKVGDLVIADASEDMTGVGKGIEILGIPEYGVVAGLHTAVLRPQVGHFAKGFLGQLQHMPKFREQARVLASGLKVYGLSKTSISKISVEIPPLKEQEAIAEVLSAMDDELEALTEQVSKLRMVKEGMMQDLLTGKVRLV
jgi:type I restriction enzyme S subunit